MRRNLSLAQFLAGSARNRTTVQTTLAVSVLAHVVNDGQPRTYKSSKPNCLKRRT